MFDLTTIARGLAAWLLTYALHSTLFLGLAWLASRRLAHRMPAVEEAVWRFALVAGLITASLQLAIGREPLSGSWRIAASERASVSVPAPSIPLSRVLDVRAMEALPAAPQAESPAPPSPAPASRRLLPVSLPLALTGIWLAGALVLATGWLMGYVRLRRRLRPRPQVLEATMVSLLGVLRERAGLRQPVRLTCSSRLPVPVALGVRRPEICVPPRALASLAPEQQEGMLAHELAHLVRRDPFWLAFGRLLASLFFLQPLNWVAVRRLREISELLCDEWAVGRTGRPVSLARCLTEVAGWSFPRSAQPLRSLPVPGMADRPSNLARRIRRLLEEARSPQRRVHPVWLAAGMLILVLAVAAAAPGVQAAMAGEAPGGETPAPALVSAGDPAPEAAPTPRPSHAPVLAGEEAEDEDEGEDIDLDIDVDVDEVVPDDFADDLEDEIERSLEGVTEEPWQIAMDLYSADMEAAMAGAELSEAETQELERRAEELSEQISKRVEEQLEPKMEELEKLVDQHVYHFENSEEMRQLARQAEEIVRRVRPSEAEMDKLHAEIEKLRADGGMSDADKQRIRAEARRMSEEHRLTDKDRAEIDAIRRQAREMAQRSMRERQPEIEQMRRQILEESRAIREEIRRQLENDPQLRELRERRQKDRERQREEMREDRDRDREHRAPRPPRPERHVHLHITPEVRVRVAPAVAPVASPTPMPHVGVRVRPAVAPVAAPTPKPSAPAVAPEAPPAR